MAMRAESGKSQKLSSKKHWLLKERKMTNVTVRVPDDIKDIVSGTSETIYVEALMEVARKRIAYTQNRLNDLQAKSDEYKKKYNKPYEEFSQNVPDTLQGHDDWIEWAHTEKILNELNKKIEKLHILIGK
ncbi:MAG: hypothetical protein HZA01_16760 [Nitrospinae bacterium]|nr:hypothetical protein [Nitrospinota bacterium]